MGVLNCSAVNSWVSRIAWGGVDGLGGAVETWGMAGSHPFPIIIMWAHPRSMSTAMERIMRERGDCECLHEPFMYYYYVHLGQRRFPNFSVEPHRPTAFGDIVEMMQAEAMQKPVFSKDMGYYVLPEIKQHVELATTIQHVFLIRDPRKSLISHHKLDPAFELAEGGLAAQWELFQWVSKTSGVNPLVIDAESVQQDPETIMGKFWQRMGLPFSQQAFNWQTDKRPADWEQVSTWHEKTMARKSIEPDQRNDSTIQSDFDRYVVAAPQLEAYLHHHWPYYLKLKEYRISTG